MTSVALAVAVLWIAPPAVAPLALACASGALITLAIPKPKVGTAAAGALVGSIATAGMFLAGLAESGAVGPDASARAVAVTQSVLSIAGIAQLAVGSVTTAALSAWAMNRAPKYRAYLVRIVLAGLCLLVAAGAMSVLSTNGVVAHLD